MPELHIRWDAKGAVKTLAAVYPTLQSIAAAWTCELIRTEEMLIPLSPDTGYVLLPEIMFSRQGIIVSEEEGGIKLLREEDATTWEDFLFMKTAHTLASEHQGLLYYENDPEPLNLEPERFATFEDYVERVLEYEDDLVKEMKRTWIYAHRKRAVR